MWLNKSVLRYIDKRSRQLEVIGLYDGSYLVYSEQLELLKAAGVDASVLATVQILQSSVWKFGSYRY